MDIKEEQKQHLIDLMNRETLKEVAERNKLDLKKLEEKLDTALENETSESLTNWLKEKRELKINNMAQTSVEWLVENAEDFFGHLLAPSIIEKANEMHKNETLRFVRTMPRENGVTQEGESYVQYDAEAHYNNTYNKM